MLISRRKEGETLRISGDIEVRIVSIRKNKVILGVIAPRDVKITAGKLDQTEMANTMAAVSSARLDQFLQRPDAVEPEEIVFLLQKPD